MISRLSHLLLGSDPRQRLRIRHTLMAASVFAFCLLLQWQGVALGWAAPSVAAWFSAVLTAGVGAFYAAIRSGATLRFADPALTMPQMVFATIAIAVGYLINPQVRGALLVVAALVLVFGAFTLAPRRCRQLGAISAAVLASVMALGAWWQPHRFAPEIEMFHMLFTVVVLPTISLLAGQLSQLRRDHQRQRGALREAMQRLETLAMLDEMTGLPNRRHAQEWFAQELARNSRHAGSLGVAIIDLDHFKRVNDTLGHSVGDEVLRTFAREARRVIRSCDVLARWGGEEFLLLMPESTPAQALSALDRLREHIAVESVWSGCPSGRVTFSAGVTSHQPGHTLEGSLQCADAALYEAKRQGRDRIVAA